MAIIGVNWTVCEQTLKTLEFLRYKSWNENPKGFCVILFGRV
jgi:hypothetical protein